jgi:GMC oxidoreductase/Pyridine nucleotide-disulphide oxidoreductase
VILSEATLTHGLTLTADLAIVGAGPAGIVTALEVAKQGFAVLLLESGCPDYSPAAQKLAEAAEWDPDRHSPMSLTVRRQLGGTSVIWGGRCVPYDRVDFDRRSFASDSPWPVSYDELRPYFQGASDWLECGRAAFDLSEMSHLPPSLVPGLDAEDGGDVRSSTFERWSLPTNFGRRYRQRLQQSAQVRVMTGLTCTRVVCLPGRDRVDHLECRSLRGHRVDVRCRAYVIAAGGLDSTRLLLASTGPNGGPPGDHSGHLGSWYMSHVEGVIANVRFATDPRATIFGFERDLDGTYVRRRLSLSPRLQHQEQLPNVVAWLANPELPDPSHRSGVLSFVYLFLRSPAGRLVASDAQRLSLSGETVPGSPYGGAERSSPAAHVGNVIRDAVSVVRFGSSFGVNHFLNRKRPIPGFFVYSKDNRYPLQYHGEQAPRRHSRVRITGNRDDLGMPKLAIDLRFSSDDVDGIIRSHRLWDAYLRSRGLGQLEYLSDDPEAIVWSRAGGGFHQLGTTRMAARAEDGVVDQDLAVHGVRNLFVASSSAFVTASQANPTFMLLAFATRLAVHLGRVLPQLDSEPGAVMPSAAE